MYRELEISTSDCVYNVRVEVWHEFHKGVMYDSDMTGTPDYDDWFWRFVDGTYTLEDGTVIPLDKSHPDFGTVMSEIERVIDY